MSVFLIHIIAKSNLAEVLAIDDAAIDMNNDKLRMNNDLLGINAKLSGKTASKKRAVAADIASEAKAFERETSAVRKSVTHWTRLGNAQNKVGWNLYGFSFRVGMWFVPAMGLMVASMIPVVMGLIAIASAAILAGGALGVFLAAGALLYAHNANKNGANGGYGGARRPYSTGGSQTSIWTTLFEPVWKVLESPKLKGAMDNAKLFLQATIYGLAEGIGRFFQAIDPGMMAMLETMFLDWLPAGLEALAKWGSQLVNVIGKGSMQRLNSFISWIAGGIMGIADWLENQGGWGQLDTLTGILADFCSVMLELGKSALPLVNKALSVIWPFPLKPILEAIQGFCDAIANNPTIMNDLETLIKIVIVIGIIAIAITAIIAIMTSNITGWIIALLLICMIIIVIRDLITDVVRIALSLGEYLINQMILWFARAVNFILGQDIDTSAYEGKTFKQALAGEYAPENWKQWDINQGKAKDDRQKFLGDLKNNTIDVFFHGDEAVVDDVIVNDVNGTKGSYDKINSNLTARRTLNF